MTKEESQLEAATTAKETKVLADQTPEKPPLVIEDSTTKQTDKCLKNFYKESKLFVDDLMKEPSKKQSVIVTTANGIRIMSNLNPNAKEFVPSFVKQTVVSDLERSGFRGLLPETKHLAKKLDLIKNEVLETPKMDNKIVEVLFHASGEMDVNRSEALIIKNIIKTSESTKKEEETGKEKEKVESEMKSEVAAKVEATEMKTIPQIIVTTDKTETETPAVAAKLNVNKEKEALLETEKSAKETPEVELTKAVEMKAEELREKEEEPKQQKEETTNLNEAGKEHQSKLTEDLQKPCQEMVKTSSITIEIVGAESRADADSLDPIVDKEASPFINITESQFDVDKNRTETLIDGLKARPTTPEEGTTPRVTLNQKPSSQINSSKTKIHSIAKKFDLTRLPKNSIHHGSSAPVSATNHSPVAATMQWI